MAKKRSKFWIIWSVILIVSFAGIITLAVLLPRGHKHPLELHGSVRETCVTGGSIAYWECKTCNKLFADERGRTEITAEDIAVPAKGHNYVLGVCSRCGNKESSPTSDLRYSEIRDSAGNMLGYRLIGLGETEKTDIVIADIYDEAPVLAISATAFANNTDITSVKIPVSVTTIENGTFFGCSNLKNIIVESGNPNYASFDGNLYTSDMSTMLYYAAGKSDLTFDLPTNVQIISTNAFYNAYYLERINISDATACKTLEERCINGCKALKNLSISSRVQYIAEGAVYNCGNLQEITVPFVGRVKKIGESNRLPFGHIFGTSYYNGSVATKQIYRDTTLTSTERTYCIPASLTTVTVNGGMLPYGAFYNCASLKKVVLNNITEIETHAFVNCNVTEVTVPQTTVKVAANAFANCRALTIYCEGVAPTEHWNTSWNGDSNPVVWNGKENNTATDGNIYAVIGGVRYALNDTNATVALQPANLQGDIVLPQTVTHKEVTYNVVAIAEKALYGCENLSSITIPQSVWSVGAEAFGNCRSLVVRCERTAIPGGWDNSWNISGCPVVLDCKNTDTATDGCMYVVVNGLRYALKNGEAVLVQQSYSLTEATIPASFIRDGSTYPVVEIAAGAFENCAISKIMLGVNVAKIGARAFAGCKNLTEIVLAEPVTTVGERAFFGCRALTIYCNAVQKPADWDGNWNLLSESTACPTVWNSAENKIATDGYQYIILNNVRYAFADGKATVVVQSNAIKGVITVLPSISYQGTNYIVESVADYAFENCTQIVNITLPEGLKTLGSYTFKGCTGLCAVTLPQSLTEIPTGCFSGCTSLTNVSVPESVEILQFNAFVGCSKLQEVEFSANSNLRTICSGAFMNCSGLAKIVIPKEVRSIGKNTFSGCIFLTSVTFKNTEGWWYSNSATATQGTPLSAADLSNAATAASLLTNTCSGCYWQRSNAQ